LHRERPFAGTLQDIPHERAGGGFLFPRPQPRQADPAAFRVAPLPRSFPTPALFDPSRGVRFRLESLTLQPRVPCRLFWGRERFPDLCWAGFELELSLRHAATDTLRVALAAVVERAR
jgi:hypothetical protein